EPVRDRERLTEAESPRPEHLRERLPGRILEDDDDAALLLVFDALGLDDARQIELREDHILMPEPLGDHAVSASAHASTCLSSALAPSGSMFPGAPWMGM